MNEKIKQVLDELTRDSELEKNRQKIVEPDKRMLAITKDTGEFFNILLRTQKTQRVLEIGLSVGYSTLWFADAILENNGTITTIEKNPDKIRRAKENFQKAGASEIINIQEGDADGQLESLQKQIDEKSIQEFDFVFIDADKENVILYFDLAWSMIKKGGIIAIDNVLYPEKYRPDMQKLQEHIRKTAQAQAVTVPIGNGEEIIIKIE